MFVSFSKTESVSLHLSSQKYFPPILKSVSTGPALNKHIHDIITITNTITITVVFLITYYYYYYYYHKLYYHYYLETCNVYYYYY